MEVAFSSSEMTGIPKEEIRDITSEAQRIVLCVDISRERYGKGLIVDILRGSRNKKILENGLDRLSTYGVLSELSREMLYLILNELCINGLLMVTADFYPVLKLTERSRKVFNNGEKIIMKIKRDDDILEPEMGLFNALRKVRREIALKDNLPPFMVLHDSTLAEVSTRMPVNLSELRRIKGFGDKKIECYGEVVLTEVLNYMMVNNIPVLERHEIPDINSIPDEDDKNDITLKSYMITYQMYKSGKNIREIAKERGLSQITIEGHIFKCCSDGLEVNLEDFIPKNLEDQIIEVIKNHKGEKRLRLLKDALPPEVQYSAIKAVLHKYGDEI